MNPLPTTGEIALALWREFGVPPRLTFVTPGETASLVSVPPHLASVAAFRASLNLRGETL